MARDSRDDVPYTTLRRRDVVRAAAIAGVAAALPGLPLGDAATAQERLKIGIIGAGNIGGALGEHWAKAGHEVRVDFADGHSVVEGWDGQDRWQRFTYKDAAKVVRAVVDPGNKIALDVDRGNNVWIDDPGPAERAATKWAARWMFWLQNLLELHLLLG